MYKIAIEMISEVARKIEMVLIMICSVNSIIRNYNLLVSCDNIVIYVNGGFGHTILGPDKCRRLWKDKKSILFYVDRPEVYNKIIEKVWPENIIVKFIDTPLSNLQNIFHDLAWPNFEQQKKLAEYFKKIVGKIFPNKNVITNFDLYKIISSIPNSTHDNAAYLALWSRTPMPPLRLDASLREEVMLSLSANASDRFCSLFLRDNPKGGEGERNRNGAPIEDYISTIDWLIARGYRVLICGDRQLDPALAARYAGALGDAQTWGIDPNVYAIFAATEVQLFIAESGGGFWLSSLAEIPTLLINHFPMGVALPGATVFYKRLVRENGNLVDPVSALRDFNAADEIAHLGVKPINNTPAELREATQEFVLRVEAGHAVPPLPKEIQEVCDILSPAMMLANSKGAGISSVWLRGQAKR